MRYGLRVIAKAPGFEAMAILTLALGIGANTTIFNWINSALLNPVPGLAKPSEVVALTLSKPGDNPFPFTIPDLDAAGRAAVFHGNRGVRLRSVEPDRKE